jgi:hypothetical protein
MGTSSETPDSLCAWLAASWYSTGFDKTAPSRFWASPAEPLQT